MNEVTVRTSGGALSYLDGGAADGPVVVVHDGYGSRLVAVLAEEAATRAGVRLITPDRPGFWGSPADDEEPLASWPQRMAGLLDEIGVHQAAVLGASAGTPFALAAAAALPDRVTALAVVGPFAPLSIAGDLDDMLPAQRRSFRMAARAPRLGTWPMRPMAALARRWPARMLRVLASQRPPVDANRMLDKHLAPTILPLVPGLLGDGTAARRELQAIVTDWSGLLGEVAQPVRVWAASEDSVHPVSMGQALVNHLTRAELVVHDGGFFTLTDAMGEVLRWCAGAPPSEVSRRTT